jgi:carboxypeptidase PM20D1
MKKNVLLAFALCVVPLASVLLVNTFRFTSRQVQVEAVQTVAVDRDGAAGRLARAIRFQTVSYQDPTKVNGDEFLALHRYLERTFPRIHAALTRELVGDYSLLYTWKGHDVRLKPVLLMAHQDVVPVDPETLAGWEQPPFEGGITDGFVWGRGSLDDKFSLMGIMEAVEMHLARGFQPQRTIYLAFGHDEEIGGHRGAAKIAELLGGRAAALEYVLDEGMAIVDEAIPGLRKPVALIGIAEKGYVSVALRVDVESGHSSMPPPQTAIGILSAAINKLEAHPMPARLEGVQRQVLDYVGPEMPFGSRLVMANLWLFAPLVERKLSARPNTNAAIRTTSAATMFSAGIKENILPSEARAIVNFRILPGDSIKGVLEHVESVVDDPRVKVEKLEASSGEPSDISNVDAAGFLTIQRTLRQVFPEVLIAPALCLGGTDSEHYAHLSSAIYRFSPLRLRPEDMKRLHGVNERTSLKDYAGSVTFYYHLIGNSAG